MASEVVIRVRLRWWVKPALHAIAIALALCAKAAHAAIARGFVVRT